MSGGSGQNRLLPMVKDVTRNIGRQLLIRHPPTLANVPLNGVVVSQLKQKLPTFRATELTSVNERFALTAFEKPTVKLELHMHIHDDNLVNVTLSDERTNVPQLYKTRQHAVSIEDFAGVLKNITSKRVIRSLDIGANDSVLRLLLDLEAEKLSSIRFLKVYYEGQETLLPLMERLAGKVQRLDFLAADNDWLQVERCLGPFTSLQRLNLHFYRSSPPLPSDWLRNVILANGQMKRLEIGEPFFLSPVVTSALLAITRIGDIRFDCYWWDRLAEHVEPDLCGRGQCQLTKLVLAMAQNGRLQLIVDVYGHSEDFFTGHQLRLCYYLLSLHKKTGNRVEVKMKHCPPEPLPAFIEDLSHYYFPQNEVKTTAADAHGRVHRYRLRVGTVTINFYPRYPHYS